MSTPMQIEGKTLLHLIDEATAVRVDLFRTFGNTLTRASALDDETGALRVLSVEDLVARTTALVAARSSGASKSTRSTPRRSTVCLQSPTRAACRAWNDNRQAVPATLVDATRAPIQLLDAHPELVVVQQYSAVFMPCERCRTRTLPARSADRIVHALGYCVAIATPRYSCALRRRLAVTRRTPRQRSGRAMLRDPACCADISRSTACRPAVRVPG